MSNTQQIIEYWLEKAHQDIASASDDLSGKRFQNAVSDAYFACFHAFSALGCLKIDKKPIIAPSLVLIRIECMRLLSNLQNL